MSPLLHNFSMFDHEDPIHLFDGGEAMRNHNGGSPPHEELERFLNVLFGEGIE